MSTNSFEAVFKRRLTDILSRAEAAGTNITSLCTETGIGRATPDRWLKRAPKTIKLIDRLEAALAATEKRSAK